MATYSTTIHNWNDPAFWASVQPSGNGHLLDFSALPSTFSVLYDGPAGVFVLSDGFTTFTVGSDGHGGPVDARLGGGATSLSQFSSVWGTQGADVMTARAGQSVFASEGDNVVTGTAGNDVIGGQGGNDTIRAGAGNDIVFAGGGVNTVDLGDGDDTFQSNDAEPGTDRVFGGRGNDWINAGAGNDTLIGGSGKGGLGNDTIFGGDGDDIIFGGRGDDTIDGGSGDDRIDGGSGNDMITTGTGRDTVILSRGGGWDVVTDFDITRMPDGFTRDRLDLSGLRGGSGPDGGVVWADIVMSQTAQSDAILQFPEGERITLLGVPLSAGAQASDAQAMGIPCFTPGTLIRTPQGELPVERLRPGDLVLTRDDGPQPVRFVAMRRLGAEELAATPALRPVRIGPGAFGNDRPLLVSPQHGVLVARVDGSEGLARAIQLARMKGGKVRAAEGARSVTYIHLVFDRHQVVFSNGLATESFYPGTRALAGLAPPAREEFARLFPDIAARGLPAYGRSARPYLRRPDLPRHLAALRLPRA